MKYRIKLRPAAVRELAKVDHPWRHKLSRKIDSLGVNPQPPGVEKLTGHDNRYRVRTGTYRIIYEIFDQSLLILILLLGHRRQVYRP